MDNMDAEAREVAPLNEDDADPGQSSSTSATDVVEERERVAKGAAATGLAAGVGLGVTGLGLSVAGVFTGVVVGVAAGGVLGLAAIGEGGKINKVAQTTGKMAVKGFDKVKEVDQKYQVQAKVEHAVGKAKDTAKAVNEKYKLEEKGRAVSTRIVTSLRSATKAVTSKRSEGTPQVDEVASDDLTDSVLTAEPDDQAELISEDQGFVLLSACIVFPNSNKPAVLHDLTNITNRNAWLHEAVEIEEGTTMQELWTFKATRDLTNVCYVRATHKSGVCVSKERIVLGNFPKSDEPYTFAFEQVSLPSGMLVRGTYKTQMAVTEEVKDSSGKTENVTLLSRKTQATVVKKQ